MLAVAASSRPRTSTGCERIEAASSSARDGGAIARDVREQDGELVTADARQAVGRAQAPAHGLGHGAQESSPAEWPQGVVDLLEVVEVEQEQRGLLAVAPAAADLALELLLEAPAVPQVGQCVVVGQALQALLQALALADVLDLGDEVLGRAVGTRRRATR